MTTTKGPELNLDDYRSALEYLATPVMLVDDDLVVTFANQATMSMLRQHAGKLAQAFPGFRPDRVLGVCIDQFHKNPSYQRQLLADPSIFPHRAEIQVADLHFSLNVSRLEDADRNTTGFALQWNDITPRVRSFDEVRQVAQALENGDLSVRGEVAGLPKEYQPFTEAINNAVDAIVEPVVVAMDVIRRIAVGEAAAPIEADYKGTFAELRDAVNGLVQTTEQITDVASRIADGDLSVQIKQRSANDRLMGALSRMLHDLNALMRKIQDASGQLDMGSNQVNEASQALADNAARSAASLQQISASMEEISVQTDDNAKNANSALDLSTNARESANLGDRQMSNMVQAMKDIDESARSISKIIKVIDDIAFQTNLLALNAAVEAGRAGVHGRGFAVVAEEVRRLAARSAQAAKETTEMIEGSSRKVNQGLEIADATAQSLSAIVKGVGEVSDLVGDIAAASQEQAMGIKEVNQSLGQVDSATQQNTAKAEEMAAASQDLSGHSASLAQQLSRFRLAGASGGGHGGYGGDGPQDAGRRHRSSRSRAPARVGGRGATNGGNLSLDDQDFGEF